MEPPNPGEVLEAILAGGQAEEVTPLLRQLTPEDRQDVLCTVCAMRTAIGRNCRSTAVSVNQILTAECSFYIDGRPTCLDPKIT
jgi:hypothetical protein